MKPADIREGVKLMREWRREGSEIQAAWGLAGQNQTAGESLQEAQGNIATFLHSGGSAEVAARMSTQARQNYMAAMGFGSPLQNEQERHEAALAKIAEAAPADAARRIEAENLQHRRAIGAGDWKDTARSRMEDIERAFRRRRHRREPPPPAHGRRGPRRLRPERRPRRAGRARGGDGRRQPRSLFHDGRLAAQRPQAGRRARRATTWSS